MRTALLVASCLSLVAAPAFAQSIAVTAGSTATTQVLPGGKLAIPVIVDITAAGAANIASLATTLNWGSSVITLDSLRASTTLGWAFSANVASAASGTASFTSSNGTALGATSTIATAYFTASGTNGGTRFTLAPSAAANASSQSVLTLLNPRALDVCVAQSGLWGDVNNDGVVNIIDAQQIARSSVSLSVADANATARRGDVTNDGSVNIIDAQQIARFSVSLSTSARTNTQSFAAPVIASAAMTPNTTQNLSSGGTVQLVATPRDGSNADITGCSSFTWSSNATSVATVNASGYVTAVGAGSATITATSTTTPGITASVTVTIAASAPTIRLALTQSGTSRGSREYIAQVTGGTIAPSNPLGFTLTGTSMTSGTMDLVMPAAGTYTVRVVALDSASASPNNFFLVGGQASVVVPANTLVNQPMTLTPAVFTNTSVPTVAALNARLPSPTWKITDPSGALDAPGRGGFCGGIQYTTTTFTQEFDGSSVDACTVGHPVTGTVSFAQAGSDAPITAQGAPGFIYMRFRGVGFLREGSTDADVYYISPSFTRGETPLTVTVAPVATVAVTPPGPSISVGATQQMTATAKDSVNGVVTGWPLTWSSSAPSVASVSATGFVTAIANGTTTISATAGGKTGTTVVTVTGGANVASITVSLGVTTVSGNATTTATAVVKDPGNNVLAVPVTWSASSPFTARVASNGTVQGLGTGTTNIVATIGNVSGSANLTVTQASAGYNIVVRTVGTVPSTVLNAVNTAAARWSQLIRSNEPDVVATNLNVAACGATGVPNLNETIDNLVIYVVVGTIDGAAGTLAQAGPCYTRSGSNHAYVGVITVDATDVASMVSDGTIAPVMLHEMGHILGIGTNWTSSGLLANPAPANPDPAGDPTFTGANAQWVFPFIGTGYAGAIVPVENCCGSGTRNSHWRETILQRELMTGFTTSGGGLNPLSPLTAASLIDLGYSVDVSLSDSSPYFDMLPGSGGRRIEIKELPLKNPPIVTDLFGRPVKVKQ